MQNSSIRSREQLYGFIEKHLFAITPNGNFLAYKIVRDDYLDCHSGTFDNSVGQEPRVERSEVDDDPKRTCSHGLHVCGKEYAEGFFRDSGSRLMLVEVDPVDVVSIPSDYNHAKMRCCGYKVVQEIGQARDDEDVSIVVDVEAGGYYNVRGDNGRFTKEETYHNNRDDRGRFASSKPEPATDLTKW